MVVCFSCWASPALPRDLLVALWAISPGFATPTPKPCWTPSAQEPRLALHGPASAALQSSGCVGCPELYLEQTVDGVRWVGWGGVGHRG